MTSASGSSTEFVRAKAAALTDPEGIDPWMLLWWNRQTRYVRFACTEGREIWVHADMPAAELGERMLDRLLGLVVEGALAVRSLRSARSEPTPWLKPRATAP